MVEDTPSSRTLVEESRRDKEESRTLRKEVEDQNSGGRAVVPQAQAVTEGTSIHVSITCLRYTFR